MTWTDSDGNIGLSWNVLEQILGAGTHAVHVGDGMFALHVVHYIEVAHFIVRGTAAENTENTSLMVMQIKENCNIFIVPIYPVNNLIEILNIYWQTSTVSLNDAQYIGLTFDLQWCSSASKIANLIHIL